ncbi:hypothetical protein K466DRAFT_570797 [Polyporus arcularius HHB13444]|uniref:Uncharacterized protein n=1 Tax=Polyporus arcularius HHB13444 TaxID=1314778 RepID=A0A5C3NPA1_9APHY|nr:hypothetical protein K466DRAFT_570797 [Polyporus arcularius HHB13444]
MTPAVFDPDPPPSDPELGRATTVIRDSHPDAQPVDYAKGVYDLDSDIDDGGPISPSTSPPAPSSFAIAHIPRSGLAQLAVAEDTTSDESSLSRSIGHTRSPVLARTPSCMSLSSGAVTT